MEGHASNNNSPTINCDNENIAPPAYSIDNLPPPNPIHNEYIQYPQFIPRRQLINEYSQQNASIPSIPSNIDINNSSIIDANNINNKGNKSDSNNYNQPLIQHGNHSPPSPNNNRYDSVIITQHNPMMANNNINPIHSPPTHIVIVPQGPKFHGPSNQYASTIAYPQLLPNDNHHHHHHHNSNTQPINNDLMYPGLNSNTRNQKLSSSIDKRPYHQDLFCLAFITFFFFPILGLLAMCKAAEANTAYQRGDYQLARIYNRQCKRYMKWAIIFCIVILLFGIVMSMFSS